MIKLTWLCCYLKFNLGVGEVAEWSNVPDSKSGVLKSTAGSNPALSASIKVSPISNRTR